MNVVNRAQKIFTVNNYVSLILKYKKGDKSITVKLVDGHTFTGKIGWNDEYAIKIIYEFGSIIIPIHNVAVIECESFLLDEEIEITDKFFRGYTKPTNKEKEQLCKYMRDKELLWFCMSDGSVIKGRLNWFVNHAYVIKPDGSLKDCIITKRYIMYYRTIED